MISKSSNFFCPICCGLSEAVVDELLKCGLSRNYVLNQNIYMQEEPYQGLYVILEGTVRLSNQNEDGKEIFIKRLGEGKAFGESGMSQKRYLENAFAVEPTNCIYFPTENLARIMSQHIELSNAILKSVNNWLIEYYDRFRVLSYLSVRKRLDLFLKSESKRLGATEFNLNLRRHEIASNLGIRPETLSRALSELSQEGLIQFHGDRVDVHRLLEITD